jgi:threonine/homoserine/homoserine lactone efflux protein
MIQTIFSGIGLGLTLAIMFGPAFFALLQTSIDKGFNNATRFAIGICVSDAFLIAIVFLGVANLMEKPIVGNIVGLAGGGMLIGLGIHTFLHRCKGREINVETEIKEAAEIQKRIAQRKLPKSGNYRFYIKGFLLNLANPAVWFFWIFSVGLVSTQYINAKGGPDIFYLTIFFLCTLGTVLITDVLKAFGAHQLKSKVNDKVMTKVNMIFALILIGFGVYLIAKSTYPIFELMLKNYHLQQI